MLLPFLEIGDSENLKAPSNKDLFIFSGSALNQFLAVSLMWSLSPLPMKCGKGGNIKQITYCKSYTLSLPPVLKVVSHCAFTYGAVSTHATFKWSSQSHKSWSQSCAEKKLSIQVVSAEEHHCFGNLDAKTSLAVLARIS